MSVLKNHRESLRVLSLAKNKVTNALMEHICDGLKDMNVMEVIDLRHLKEAKNVDWVKMLTSISTLSSNRKKNVQIMISGYQTHLKQKDIHTYLESETPFIEINIM